MCRCRRGERERERERERKQNWSVGEVNVRVLDARGGCGAPRTVGGVLYGIKLGRWDSPQRNSVAQLSSGSCLQTPVWPCPNCSLPVRVMHRVCPHLKSVHRALSVTCSPEWLVRVRRQGCRGWVALGCIMMGGW
jgi:hypothetical protein